MIIPISEIISMNKTLDKPKSLIGVPLKQRFAVQFRINENGCWEWIGSITKCGYGVIWNQKLIYAHRLSYEFFKGPIPNGKQMDHLCRHRHCVNPAHLEAVT